MTLCIVLKGNDEFPPEYHVYQPGSNMSKSSKSTFHLFFLLHRQQMMMIIINIPPPTPLPAATRVVTLNSKPTSLNDRECCFVFLGLSGSRNGFGRPNSPPKHSLSFLHLGCSRSDPSVIFLWHQTQPKISLQSCLDLYWAQLILMHSPISSGCAERGQRGFKGGDPGAQTGRSLKKIQAI